LVTLQVKGELMDSNILELLSGLNNGAGTTNPSPFPTQPNPTQGPLLAGAPEERSWISKLFGTNKVGQPTVGGVGMDNIAAVLGQLAKAIGPKDGLGSKLGDFASQLGQAKLQELAATQQHKHLTTMLSSLFADPSKTKSLVNGGLDASLNSKPGSILEQTPASLYGVDESKTPTTRT
jgi:hypothetical protein